MVYARVMLAKFALISSVLFLSLCDAERLPNRPSGAVSDPDGHRVCYAHAFRLGFTPQRAVGWHQDGERTCYLMTVEGHIIKCDTSGGCRIEP